jgi:MoaA/NifB/PqqE/SkfB family radical SAM enzyme
MIPGVRRLLGIDSTLGPPLTAVTPRAYARNLDRFQKDCHQVLCRDYSSPRDEVFCKLIALKVTNAFAVDYQFRKRHSVLAGFPVQLQMDPTNACHMHCPSCLHSANPEWSSRFDWPSGSLTQKQFSDFCSAFAPFATSIALFRDGEPLLHRQLPEFVRTAKRYLLQTLTSTSLSMRIDADALVESGLDRLNAAIDGGSESSYERYRRGGDFKLVLENLRSIVRARNARASRKPWLVWQFLAFEHNAHEISATAELARQIGVDQFTVAKPHSVEHDDPEIRVAEDAPFGETVFSEHSNWWQTKDREAAAIHKDLVDDLFQESWVDRFAPVEDEKTVPSSSCSWLYYSLTMDGARRITPCCLPPMGAPEPRHLVYSNFDGANTREVLNSPDAVTARRECRRNVGESSSGHAPQPYCLNCDQNPPPPMLADVAAYVRSVDDRGALPPTVTEALSASPVFSWNP